MTQRIGLTSETTLADGDWVFSGTASLPANAVDNASVKADASIARSKLAQDTVQSYVVPLTSMRVWNAIGTNLPNAAAADDLGIEGNTFGTGSPTLQTSDAKATTVTQYARFQFGLPPEYDSGQTVEIRIHGGMNTTVSDDTATVDVECYESNKEGGISADLCTTAAQSINSLTFGDDDFTITATSLAAGDVLDVRITVAITDAATGTAVIGEIGSVEVRLDIRG